MAALALTLTVGALLGQFVALPCAAELVSTLAVVGVPVAWWCCGRLSAALLFIVLWSALQGHWYLARVLPRQQAPLDTQVRGCIDEFPRASLAGKVVTLRLLRGAAQLPRLQRVRLRSFAPELELLPATCWQLRVRLKPPHGQANPGQFDRAAWLYREGLHATGYIMASKTNRRLDGARGAPLVLQLRAAALSRLALPEAAGAELLPGILLGVRSALTAAHWEVLRLTGTSHLLAISGLHVGLVAGFAWQLGQLVRRLVRLPVDAALAPLLSCAAALGYALLAGLSVATVRAAAMLSIALLLRLSRRQSTWVRALWLVLAGGVLAHPVAVLGSGFWLSYGAVAALLLCLARSRRIAAAATVSAAVTNGANSVAARLCAQAWVRLRSWSRILASSVRELVRAQLLLTLALLLPMLLLFGQVAPYAPLTNLVAIPFFALLVMPVALSGAAISLVLGPDYGAPLLELAAHALGAMLAALEALSELPGAAWSPGARTAAGWLLASAGAVLVIVPRPLRRVWSGLILLCVGLSLPPAGYAPEARVLVLDVGQGTAVLLWRAGRAVLFDTGPGWPGGDAVTTTIRPILRHLGIRALDAVVVSHADADHAGGLANLRKRFPAAQLWLPAELAGEHRGAVACRRGQLWTWQGLEFELLHPRDEAGLDRNDRSCVVRVRSGSAVLWLPGDVEQTGEQLLAARTEPAGDGLLIVPHHGSVTSSSKAMRELTQPRFAVITNGHLNRWGFPHPDVVAEWRASGSCVLTTAAHGAAEFALSPGDGAVLKRLYAAHWRRPWPVRASARLRCSTIKAAGRGV